MRMRVQFTANLLKLVVAGVALFASDSAFAQDAPPPPPSLQELLAGKNPLMKAAILQRNPLLKDIFAKVPPAELKGLASKIRAGELDVKNRIKAVQYLATVDCKQFPEAPKMLVKTMQTDEWEPVRYESAVALKYMMTAGKRSQEEQPSAFRGWMRRWRTNTPTVRRGDEKRRADYCQGCCDTKILKELAKTAYDFNDDGTCLEPSKRVREMAASAIKMCGIPCNHGHAEAQETGPTAIPVPKPGTPNPVGPQAIPIEEPEEPEDAEPEDKVSALSVSHRRVIRKVAAQAPDKTPIRSLNGLCVVTMAQGQPQKASPVFEAVYQGRIYQFSGPEAKMAFQRTPEAYSVAFGGYDPVQYVDSQQLVEGRYLLRHNNRMYNFATQANWKKFQLNASRYVLNNRRVDPPKEDVIAVSNKPY